MVAFEHDIDIESFSWRPNSRSSHSGRDKKPQPPSPASLKSFSAETWWMSQYDDWGRRWRAGVSRGEGREGAGVRFARRLPRAGSPTSPPARRPARQCQGRCSRGQLTSGGARGAGAAARSWLQSSPDGYLSRTRSLARDVRTHAL